MSIDFAAIDFETANSERSSPCALGFVIVRNGKIVDEQNLLMRPPNSTGPEDFDDFNVGLHGIGWDQVKNEPFFSEIWESLVPVIGDLPLVAHNAPFDLGFLKAAAKTHKCAWPDDPVLDTVRLARSVLERDEVANCKLSTLATFFGAATSPTHRALDDARATVDVLHGIFERLGTFEVTTLHELLNFKRKRSKRPLD